MKMVTGWGICKKLDRSYSQGYAKKTLSDSQKKASQSINKLSYKQINMLVGILCLRYSEEKWFRHEKLYKVITDYMCHVPFFILNMFLYNVVCT